MNDSRFIEEKFPISEATRRRNPQLFGLGQVEGPKPKLAPIQTLVDGVQKPAGSQGRVAICITIVQYRRRLLDGHDNLAYAVKPLVDAIAQSLGVDDGDKRLRWEYGQVQTAGEQGTSVKITTNQEEKICQKK